MPRDTEKLLMEPRVKVRKRRQNEKKKRQLLQKIGSTSHDLLPFEKKDKEMRNSDHLGYNYRKSVQPPTVSLNITHCVHALNLIAIFIVLLEIGMNSRSVIIDVDSRRTNCCSALFTNYNYTAFSVILILYNFEIIIELHAIKV